MVRSLYGPKQRNVGPRDCSVASAYRDLQCGVIRTDAPSWWGSHTVLILFFKFELFLLTCAACDVNKIERFPHGLASAESGRQTVVGTVKFVATVKTAPQLTVFM